jgi:hypothetical protein
VKPRSSTIALSPAVASFNVWKIGWIAGIAGLLVWVVVFLVLPPRIPSGDLICFKDPGINFAHGEGLVARLNPGNPTLEPKIYSNYPPLFPILYGYFVRAFGVSPKADQCFDLLTSAAACLVFWFFVIQKKSGRTIVRAAILLLCVVLIMMPTGPFWTQRERPDALGFCLILMSIMLLQSRRLEWSFLSAGVVGGINCCLSPYAFLLNCVALLLFGIQRFATEATAGRLSFRRTVLCLTSGLVGGALPIGLLLMVSYMVDPDATSRFLANALGGATGGQAGLGYFLALMKGDVAHYLSAFARFDSIRYKSMAAHLVVTFVAAGLFVAWNFRQITGSIARWIACAIVLIALIPVVLFPYQPCYMSFTATVMVALLVRFALINGWQPYRVQLLGIFSIVFIALPATGHLLRELALTGKAAPSYERMDRMIASLEPGPNQEPPLVASGQPTYFSFKSRRFRVVDLAYLRRPEDAAQIDYFAVPGGRESPGGRQFFLEWGALNLEEIYSAATDYSSPLLNPRFTYTWECSILRQKRSN